MNNFLKLLPVFKAVNSSLTSNESINFVVEGFSPLKDVNVYLDIAKIEESEDEWVASITPSSITYSEKGFNFLIDKLETFKTGQYLVKAGLARTGDPTPCMCFSKLPSDFGVSIFEIRENTQPTKSHDQLVDYYEKVFSERHQNFLKTFGEESSADTQSYLAFVFVKNCLLTKAMRLGQYEFIPFEGLTCTDITSLINSFLSKSNLGTLGNIEDTLRKAQQGQPTFVAHFPKVIAKNADSAGKIVESEINILNNLLSIHRNSYAEIVGCVLLNVSARQMYHRIVIPDYRGNLLGGDIAGEFPRAIITQMEKVRKNRSLQLYVSLYKEALKETKTEFAYFRFWNLIETIARSKNYIGRPLKDWQGNITKNRKNQDRAIRDRAAVELVFELFRETFSSGSTNDNFLASHLAQGQISKIIPIWYRHRNCVVHGGGCFPNDVTFCLPKDEFMNCKIAHDEIVNNFSLRDRFTDEYLGSLERATNRIISSEIENCPMTG